VAPGLGRLQITGNDALGIAGDFHATLILTDADTMSLRNARIMDEVRDSQWNIAGRVNVIRIADEVEGWVLEPAAVVRTLNPGDVIDATVISRDNINLTGVWYV